MEQFPSDLVLKNVENELKRGGELAKQLQFHLIAQISSQETLVLLNEILNSYDRLQSMLKYGGTGGSVAGGGGCSGATAAIMVDSHSNDNSDQACMESGEKGVPRRTEKVAMCGDTEIDYRHSWRKYGQKDILRSKYPRCYYRCTHKNGQGCLAKKQVQRSDEDPTTFEVIYTGIHTCHNNPQIPIIDKPKTTLSDENLNQSHIQQEPFFNIQTSLRVIDNSHDKQYSIPSSSGINSQDDPIFSDGDLLLEDFLVDFTYTPAPESSYFNDYEMFINHSEDTGSELDRVVAGMDSAAKPPTQDVVSLPDLSSGHGSNFGFGNSSFFP